MTEKKYLKTNYRFPVIALFFFKIFLFLFFGCGSAHETHTTSLYYNTWSRFWKRFFVDSVFSTINFWHVLYLVYNNAVQQQTNNVP
jgi:hypothetical protein